MSTAEEEKTTGAPKTALAGGPSGAIAATHHLMMLTRPVPPSRMQPMRLKLLALPKSRSIPPAAYDRIKDEFRRDDYTINSDSDDEI